MSSATWRRRRAIDRALVLNPNLATAWHFGGWVRIYLGMPSTAIEHLAHAMRLSPLDPCAEGMETAMAFAHFFAGRYDEAGSWADRAIRVSRYHPQFAWRPQATQWPDDLSVRITPWLACVNSIPRSCFPYQGRVDASACGRPPAIRRGLAESRPAGMTMQPDARLWRRADRMSATSANCAGFRMPA